MRCVNPPSQEDVITICRRGLAAEVGEKLLGTNIWGFDQLNMVVAEIEMFFIDNPTYVSSRSKTGKDRVTGKEVNAVNFSPMDGDSGEAAPSKPNKRAEGKAPITPLSERMKTPYSFKKEHTKKLFNFCVKNKLITIPELRRPAEVDKVSEPNYCGYHRMLGHAIEDCYVFKNEVEKMIQKCLIDMHDSKVNPLQPHSWEQQKQSANVIHVVAPVAGSSRSEDGPPDLRPPIPTGQGLYFGFPPLPTPMVLILSSMGEVFLSSEYNRVWWRCRWRYTADISSMIGVLTRSTCLRCGVIRSLAAEMDGCFSLRLVRNGSNGPTLGSPSLGISTGTSGADQYVGDSPLPQKTFDLLAMPDEIRIGSGSESPQSPAELGRSVCRIGWVTPARIGRAKTESTRPIRFRSGQVFEPCYGAPYSEYGSPCPRLYKGLRSSSEHSSKVKMK
ncbi:hypothetical protein Taro_038595 [Colocasia esculenta]|uniref:Uncharacterized protein n=1 Tax=Colocasia esculenta TaxID=4460 RepID=A0A843WEB2_COLES|nr:hypothetical protein [Colocasia esculenta]